MLLPLKRAACAADLALATQLAGRVLKAAAGSRANRFDERRFRKTVHEGSWLLKRPRSVVRAIKALFRLPRPERRALRDAFFADIAFDTRVDDPGFWFAYPGLPQRAREAGKAFLVALYEDVLGRAGFEGLPGQTSTKLDFALVESSYRAANCPTGGICPACLTSSLEPPSKNRSLVDREHFFPKSRYPPLAIHPTNLTLLCIQCNERVKRDADPVGTPGPGALLEVYVPYLRAGLSEIIVSFDTATGPIRVRLDGNRIGPHASARVRNFDRLYDLSHRWTETLVRIHETLIEAVKMRCSRPLSRDGVIQELRMQIRQNDRSKHRLPDAYLTARYAEWLIKGRLKSFMQECAV